MRYRFHVLAIAALVAICAGSAHGASAASPTADLVLRVFASTEAAYVGQKVVYTVTVLNRGPSEAAGVTITHALGGRVELRAATLDSGTCTTTAPPTCLLPTLARSRTARARFIIEADAPGEFSHDVSVTSSTPDADMSSNQATVKLLVKAGHAGPPRVNAKGRVRASIEKGMVAATALVGVDEPARVVIGARELPSGRALVLQRGTRVGSTALRGPRGSVQVEVRDRATLRLTVVIRRRSGTRSRVAITVRAVDTEGEATQLQLPFALPRAR